MSNKYYCTGEVLENGYLKCVTTERTDVKNWNEYVNSLPLAALVVGGKTGWLEGYVERYQCVETIKDTDYIECSKYHYDCMQPQYRRIVLEKKPEEKSEDWYPGKSYQRLFDAINEGSPNPLQSQMDDIIQIVHEDFPRLSGDSTDKGKMDEQLTNMEAHFNVSRDDFND